MKSEGVVEYAINARLNYIHRGAHKVLYTTVPITIRHSVDSSVRLGQSMECRNHYPMKVQSQRLLPGMEDAELSLGQKARKLLHSSKVPEFWYEIAMTIPTAIQLNNWEPFPLILNFLHREDKTSVGIKDHPQRIQVSEVNLRLHHITAVMAPSNIRSNYPQKDQQTNEMDLHLEKVFDELESPLVIHSVAQERERAYQFGKYLPARAKT